MQILNRYTDYSHSKGARKNFQYAAGRSSKVTLSQSILPTTDCQLVCLSAHSKWWWIACAYEVCTKAIRKIDSVEPHIITSLWQYALCNRCIITRKLKLFVCMHIASHACKPASDGKAPCELPTKKKAIIPQSTTFVRWFPRHRPHLSLRLRQFVNALYSTTTTKQSTRHVNVWWVIVWKVYPTEFCWKRFCTASLKRFGAQFDCVPPSQIRIAKWIKRRTAVWLTNIKLFLPPYTPSACWLVALRSTHCDVSQPAIQAASQPNASYAECEQSKHDGLTNGKSLSYLFFPSRTSRIVEFDLPPNNFFSNALMQTHSIDAIQTKIRG